MSCEEIASEDWKGIEADLKSNYARFDFNYQGRKIEVKRLPVGEGKTQLAVFIDGKINIGWGYPDSDDYDPITCLIWRKRSKALYPPKEKARLEKSFGKRRIRKVFSNFDHVQEWYDPLFPKASVLVRQFKKLDGLTLSGSLVIG